MNLVGEYSLNKLNAEMEAMENISKLATKPQSKDPPIWVQNRVYLLHHLSHWKFSSPVNTKNECSKAARFPANTAYTTA